MADVEVFIVAVEAELEAMGRERVGVHRRGCKPDLALRRRVIGLIWMLTFGGMQWRIAGLLVRPYVRRQGLGGSSYDARGEPEGCPCRRAYPQCMEDEPWQRLAQFSSELTRRS